MSMKFDIFLSISQTDVDGVRPNEKTMFENFFDQVKLADELGFETAWVAETHLSCQTQKENSYAVVPHFQGEIGLNTDILQMAHKIFAMTKNINVGSAIRNILCNGGPIAHAEAIRTFLSLHGLNPKETRKLELGFASGRFEFSNRPYGVAPRNELERVAWPVVKGKILNQATEIFLRLLKGEDLCSDDISAQFLRERDFRTSEDWERALKVYQEMKGNEVKEIPLDSFYNFEKVGVIPREAPMHLLNLTIGTHDPELQKLANRFCPVGVFNLSITPPKVIDETHARMSEAYHPDGGVWTRSHMPRTAMVFLDDTPGLSDSEKSEKAKSFSEKAWKNYWTAMEGTIDDEKVKRAVDNTLSGHPDELAEKINQKYHPEDRLMLWFDFNNHDNEAVKKSMQVFMEKVAPKISSNS